MPANEGGAPDLEAVADQVVKILLDSFGFPDGEARHRMTLWKSQQHNLAGQALEAILPSMTQSEQDAALLKWALEGMTIESDLLIGAERLDIGLDPAE